jgi:hypothetical protein
LGSDDNSSTTISYASSKRRSEQEPEESANTSPTLSGATNPTAECSSQYDHIVGPVGVYDAKILEQHNPEVGMSPYKVVSNDLKKPVMLIVDSQPTKNRAARRPGVQQREIVEQIVGPFISDLMTVYAYLCHRNVKLLICDPSADTSKKYIRLFP